MKRTFSMITPEFRTILRSDRVKVKAARTIQLVEHKTVSLLAAEPFRATKEQGGLYTHLINGWEKQSK